MKISSQQEILSRYKVPWEAPQNQFVCPCHASAFDARGDVLNPPAPRALDLFPVIIEAGLVKVKRILLNDVQNNIKYHYFYL